MQMEFANLPLHNKATKAEPASLTRFDTKERKSGRDAITTTEKTTTAAVQTTVQYTLQQSTPRFLPLSTNCKIPPTIPKQMRNN